MAEAASRLASVDDFLAFEGEPDTRYQLIRGVITAMAPESHAHAALIVRLSSRLATQVAAPRHLGVDAGIRLEGRDDTFWQADLVVAGSRPEACGSARSVRIGA